MSDLELDALIAIARRAGEIVRELYRSHLEHGIEVSLKGPDDPVTVADQRANTEICEALAERFPGDAVIAEESVDEITDHLEQLVARRRVFWVDPLDGTRELVDKTGEFAVMIGLAVAGRAEAGVVYAPATGELLAGRVGVAAFSESVDGARRSLTVGACSRFADARMVASRSHRPAIIEPLRRRLGVAEPIACGSVGLKVARLVSREADFYVHAGVGMKRWDTCGPEAILRAAGGRMTDLDGVDIDYSCADPSLLRGLVATNGVLHAGVLSAVGWAEREVVRLGLGS